ncbi:MAG: 4Fe-4S binding protein [Planctomycetaceae bacterium]|jgi:NADH-quinone oxidoreductase subunit I|nr:4Fe-4S binding protein [Planctomycetaceae bacterium]
MSSGYGIIKGHLVTLRRFLLTFWRDIRTGKGLHRRGGGHQLVDFWFGSKARGTQPTVVQDSKTEGLFTVEYPDERLPVYERFRVLPVLIYDTEDGNVRCTSCNICAKVCPPQCIWMTQAKGPKGVVPLPEEFFIDMDVCMNCGLCAEYCPFDAIKMDQNFELSNYERHQTHIYCLQDLLVSSEFYARTHPEAWNSADEVAERNKVAKKKDQRLQKALAATAKPAAAPKAAPKPVSVQQS